MLPTITSAFRLSDLQGQSALDLMNQKMDGVTVGNLPQLPPELVGKTIAQLKALGATEVAQLDVGGTAKRNGMQQEVNLSPES